MDYFFQGSFQEWKARKFDPPRLWECINTNDFEMSAALMKSMTYNTHFEACKMFLTEKLRSNWLSEYIRSNRLNEGMIELCLQVAESGVCSDLVQEVLRQDLLPKVAKSRSAAKSHYLHALSRVLEESSIDQESTQALPRDPPRFSNGHSMWQWHLDFARQQSLSKLIQYWRDAESRADLLYSLFTPMRSEDSLPAGRVLFGAMQNSRYYIEFEGGLIEPSEAVTRLKATAAKTDPIFGKTLSAAAVFYRRQKDSKNLSMCRKLDPLEHLSTSEVHRYLVDAGADVLVMRPEEVMSLKVSARCDSMIFPRLWLLDPEKRLNVLILLHLGAFDIFKKIPTSALPLALKSIVDPAVQTTRMSELQTENGCEQTIYSVSEISESTPLILATRR